MTTRAADREVSFPQADGSRVPYRVFSSQEVYDREQERIYRGPHWSFVALAAEIPNLHDFKSTFIGDTPVVVTRTEDGFSCWVNRCAHRGAIVCREKFGNRADHTCVYHQWNYNANGALQGVPFRRGIKADGKRLTGMAKDFQQENFGLRTLRVADFHGLLFATFSEETPDIEDYLGPEMQPWVERIVKGRDLEYLGCTRQYAHSNWKLYYENVKDPYHASLLHLFHTTFNIFRVGMKARSIPDSRHGLHSIITVTKPEQDADTAAAYQKQSIRSMDSGFTLEDPYLLGQISEFDEDTTNHIQTIFPQLVIQQIHNTLVARQVLPKGPGEFELVFHFFGYADDTPELRELRLLQANLVGPAGYISMEDTEVTELVQDATVRDGDATSFLGMALDAPDEQDTNITESLIRNFWAGYQKVMGY
ncbi:aromatic ring-hydroxylating dioxygenase subunit alpha [Granulicoccus phenolivorans]|uniref:aromatic ring-hydroxylating dioxygenase subunit alpha n=1 Tax=Granulicoccus phenolivorans TaxID=266854 RepID=UPI001B7FDBD8|nr:aromatic ring-hydroxylating dioxygenase subunit alpha [Granulicoccus phenolivorans]